MDASIVRVGTPLDEPGGVELVDEPHDGDRRQIEDAGQLCLACALAALQPGQHRPLGAGRRNIARALVGIGAQQAGYVMKGETEFARSGERHGSKLRYNIQAYNLARYDCKTVLAVSRRCERMRG